MGQGDTHNCPNDRTRKSYCVSNFIYKIFPEAKFLEMQRDPLDNIASVLKEPWGPNTPEKAIPWWRDRVELAANALKTFPAESSLTLQLEDLVRDKRSESYKKMLDLIGLKDEAAMREYFDNEVTFERAHIGRWKQDFADPAEFEALFNRLSK